MVDALEVVGNLFIKEIMDFCRFYYVSLMSDITGCILRP